MTEAKKSESESKTSSAKAERLTIDSEIRAGRCVRNGDVIRTTSQTQCEAMGGTWEPPPPPPPPPTP